MPRFAELIKSSRKGKLPNVSSCRGPLGKVRRARLLIWAFREPQSHFTISQHHFLLPSCFVHLWRARGDFFLFFLTVIFFQDYFLNIRFKFLTFVPFLLSGTGGRGLGWHHEQQRAVSCIPVAHLLNFTEKCQKKKKRNKETTPFLGLPKLPISDFWPWARQVSYWSLWRLNTAQKKARSEPAEAQALTVNSVYLT